MTRIIGYVCVSIMGGIAFLAGIYFLIGAVNGMSDVVAVTGKIKVVEPADEDLLGLTDMGPVIFRNAEMFQYCKEEVRVSKAGSTNTYPYVTEEFKNTPQSDFEGYESIDAARRLFGSMKKYKNPEFPKEFLNENGVGRAVFCGKVEIGDDKIRLGDSLLKYFEGYDFTMEDSSVPAAGTPEDAGERFGLRLTGEGVYSSGDSDNPQIGDLRVTYRVVAPEALEGEFTAVGKLSEDNVLEQYDDNGALYHGRVSLEEANRNYRIDQLKTGLLFSFVGVLIVAGGFFLIHLFN